MTVLKAEKQNWQMVIIEPLVTFLKHVITSVNMWVLIKSKGHLGNSFLGVPVLLLHSVGFKSGNERVTPLFYFKKDGKVIIVGSNGGNPKNPAWVKNVTLVPEIKINIKGKEVDVKAHLADEDEQDLYWPMVIETFAVWQRFQERSERQFPIVVLEPQ